MNIAIVGATGNVGRKILEVLEKKELIIDNLYLLASSRSAGSKIKFSGKEHEVIDLENPNNVCEDMAPNSNLLNHFSSGLINTNLPLVCGGLSQYNYYDECFVIGRKSNTLIAQMKHPRSNAASLPLPDALWVLGSH